MSEKPANESNPGPENRGNDSHGPRRNADQAPMVAPCRDLRWNAAFGWLKRGWADYRAVPRISRNYGIAIFLVSLLLSLLAMSLGGWVLLFAMLTGFVFIAPLLAFALYSVSRQLASGGRPSLNHTLRAVRRPFANAMVYGLVLLIIFLIWARAGSMVHIFFPVAAEPEWYEMGTFLLIGSMVGAIFAGFTFAASAFSLPMLANREVDVVTAVVTSINAVLRNKTAMIVWASVIVVLTVLGIATALLGLIVVIPWLGYATWHAYHETVDVSAWPTLPTRDRESKNEEE